ncbi:hypothetical protein Z517_05691 [Fonsecaea pedrosoi CBS 271.37]|uniref:Unplaced genomic scaffold supercont1.3, whole genome shotgun sequence n=1 Tax=Fonsecaea pedrosoi CBS 271.37 TaxID=1442368 RepID=A0A0D2HDV2_9EURO|nr:uncharacterized protein Z517_05691 [Fonsecaea pedrosoi CBS 271.37]KIW82664.1 hypothetical protein Z517_05691 [Fonsecaea pedrosoi CBS 271.37]
MVKFAFEKSCQLDYAFKNVALPQVSKKAHELTAADWERQISITLNGTFLCLKYEVAAMLQTGSGSIVNTSSGAGVIGFLMSVEYSAAKFGVVGLTRTAALDYACDKTRINHVSRGAIRTPMLQSAMDKDPKRKPYVASTNPMKRIADPGEVDEGVVRLLSDAASFVTGSCLAIDGGYLP